LDETLKPIITTREVNESDNVCQASAIIAMEKVLIPTQYFKPKRRLFRMIDIVPSKYPIKFLFFFDICFFVLFFFFS